MTTAPEGRLRITRWSIAAFHGFVVLCSYSGPALNLMARPIILFLTADFKVSLGCYLANAHAEGSFHRPEAHPVQGHCLLLFALKPGGLMRFRALVWRDYGILLLVCVNDRVLDLHDSTDISVSSDTQTRIVSLIACIL